MAASRTTIFATDSIWPHEAIERLQRIPNLSQYNLSKAILHERAGSYLKSENCALAALADCISNDERIGCRQLLARLRLKAGKYEAAAKILHAPLSEDHDSAKSDQSSLTLDDVEPSGQHLHRFKELLTQKNGTAIQAWLKQWPNNLNGPEALELQAHGWNLIGSFQQGERLLNHVLSQGAGSPRAWRSVIELNLNAGRSTGLAVAKAQQLHPQDPGILSHSVLAFLHSRQPASARRTAFRERLQYSLGRSAHSLKQSDTNLLAAMEITGRADLLPCLHPAIEARLTDSPALLANFVMQLGSQCSPRYGDQAEALSNALPQRDKINTRPFTNRIRVGLISPDLFYHPVGRFLQMLLKAGFGKAGTVHLINTGNQHLQCLQDLCPADHYHHLKSAPREQQLEKIRHLNLDIAVDLAGWTGNNNGWLFAKGVAPIQINYLGYFASSGLSAMDIWLGDHELFPDVIQEWHSEQIVRLKRPFLAWAPSQDLPEGRVDVPPAPQGPITFGSFNNSRKLSSATLTLWGKILHALPGSRLALKAYGSDDPGLTQLIEQRMLNCGLDPTRVRWLPTCPATGDHLRQYGLIDIALDPFPNGGCTTTCEALWMGVPVISLCGSHYVSRMSTAVLRGANLGEWVAESEEQYLELAQKGQEQLAAIRSNRSALREHVRQSPLGDVDDLAVQLWQCFEDLVAAKLKAAD